MRTSRQATDVQNRPRACGGRSGLKHREGRPTARSPAEERRRGWAWGAEGWARGANSGEDAPGSAWGPRASGQRPVCTAGRSPAAGPGALHPGPRDARGAFHPRPPQAMLQRWGARESAWRGEHGKGGSASLQSWRSPSARKQQGVGGQSDSPTAELPAEGASFVGTLRHPALTVKFTTFSNHSNAPDVQISGEM